MSTQEMSTKALRRLEREATKRLLEIRFEGDPGRGGRDAEAQAARDRRIAEAQELKLQLEAARGALAEREVPKRWGLDRFRGSGFSIHAAADDANVARERMGAERRAFHAEIADAQAERNAAELQRRRDLGLTYEPTGEGGGDAPAALFSSATLWDYTEMKIRNDGTVGQILNARHLITLFWVANLIQEHGGEAATIAAGTAPHWPDQDGEVTLRDADIAHLAANNFIEVERQLGAGGTVTYRYGTRTRSIVKSYREHLRKAA